MQSVNRRDFLKTTTAALGAAAFTAGAAEAAGPARRPNIIFLLADDLAMGGTLRGFKRSMYEGGLRQAALARWPGVVPAGRVSDEPWAFWDFLPTAAELAGAAIPAGCHPDGLSLVSFLNGGAAPKRDYFYWELQEGGRFIQAVRFGNWKAVRNGPSAAIELYDLATDTAEKTNLAAARPELVARAQKLLKDARTDDPNWPLRDKRGDRPAR